MIEQALVIFLLVPLQSVAAAEHITRSLLSGVLTDCWVLFRVEAFAVLHEAQLFKDTYSCAMVTSRQKAFWGRAPPFV